MKISEDKKRNLHVLLALLLHNTVQVESVDNYDVHTITAKVIARDSKYCLISILVSLHGFDKVTNIQKLSQGCS